MKFKTLVLPFIAGMVFTLAVIAFLSFRPVPKATPENSHVIQGTLDYFSTGDSKSDLYIYLERGEHFYYMNRAVVNGMDPVELTEKYEGKEISLTYVDHWSLMNPNSNIRPVITFE